MILSIDTETTGVDFWHGARPFFVTTCDDSGRQTFWEWTVDPRTREVRVPPGDPAEIQELLDRADRVVGQNLKFDALALSFLGVEIDWSKADDTLIAGHLLASNQPHDLTSMVLQYLGEDIEPLEKGLEEAVKECRRVAKKLDFRIAKDGLPEMPSASDKTWRFDYWLPAALAARLKLAPDHPWRTALREYSNKDSEGTLRLWFEMEEEVRRRGLWNVYRERMLGVRVAIEMEERGISLSLERLNEQRRRFREECDNAERTCAEIAGSSPCSECEREPVLLCGNCGGSGRIDKLPRLPKGVSKMLREVMFGDLNLPAVGYGEKSGEPSIDKAALEAWMLHLPDGRAKEFVRCLRDFRKRTTALNYMDGYEQYGLPIDGAPGWLVLHPSLNPTGTDTLRWSSNHPNEQNISKQEGFNLRYSFGPSPGREWWSLDAKNIELRIPAYESGERDLIEVFERPHEPPYYGSYHLVVFDALHPELFRKHGKECKTLFESTYYQWVKNGNFAMIYGAQEKTADASYRVRGAYAKVRNRFPKIAGLSDRWKAIADKTGFVETIPDRSVCPERGYPIMCTRTEWGKVLPTVPLNYHVQSTAMWWMLRAMNRTGELLRRWRADGFDAWLVMQVHDELVFDLPAGEDNLPRVREIQKLMEEGGRDIGVPTPVDVEYHEHNWAEGRKV